MLDMGSDINTLSEKMNKFGSFQDNDVFTNKSETHTASRNLNNLFPNNTNQNSPIWKSRGAVQTPNNVLRLDFNFNMETINDEGELNFKNKHQFTKKKLTPPSRTIKTRISMGISPFPKLLAPPAPIADEIDTCEDLFSFSRKNSKNGKTTVMELQSTNYSSSTMNQRLSLSKKNSGLSNFKPVMSETIPEIEHSF